MKCSGRLEECGAVTADEYVRGECAKCDSTDNKEKLEYIKDIEARFYSWTLSETQEIDFAWLCKTLKEELNGTDT